MTESVDLLRTFYDVTFGGVGTAQWWSDFYLWEKLLNAHPEMKAVMELGTDRGGFSLYLEMQCKFRGIEYKGYDVFEPEVYVEGFEKLDIFLNQPRVVETMNSFEGPIVLFCDNGNKPRELKVFSSKTPKGSIIAVHDWGTETLPSDVPDWLEEIYGEFCDQLGSMTRVFKVKGES